MLNLCIFVLIAYAVGCIVSMMIRPTEFFTVFRKRR